MVRCSSAALIRWRDGENAYTSAASGEADTASRLRVPARCSQSPIFHPREAPRHAKADVHAYSSPRSAVQGQRMPSGFTFRLSLHRLQSPHMVSQRQSIRGRQHALGMTLHLNLTNERRVCW